MLLALALVPLASLLWAIFADTLGANPAEALIRATGDWTLRLLCLTLAVTPVRVVMGWSALARWRRMLGLCTYLYATLHLLCYSLFDMGLDVGGISADITKRPFILVGFSAFVLLTALAATSYNRAIRVLGAARWQALHKLIYLIALLALLHFYWMRAGKNDFAEVGVYGLVVAALLGWRVRRWLRQHLGAKR